MKNAETDEVVRLIKMAIDMAVEKGLKNLDGKIAEAINLGVKIGAATGAEIGAKAAVEAVEKERKAFRKQQYDKKFQNTKLLLRNYRRLNKYYDNAVFDRDGAMEADEDFESIMDELGGVQDDELLVESIKRNFARTKVIMTHVNKMLGCYREMCQKSSRIEDSRRWRVLDGLYLSADYTTAEEIARKEDIDKRTVYKDVDICANDLMALLFGVGGIKCR